MNYEIAVCNRVIADGRTVLAPTRRSREVCGCRVSIGIATSTGCTTVMHLRYDIETRETRPPGWDLEHKSGVTGGLVNIRAQDVSCVV